MPPSQILEMTLEDAFLFDQQYRRLRAREEKQNGKQ
nr:MAG TPA: hypothetical protein [Caudoviricetes sp.]